MMTVLFTTGMRINAFCSLRRPVVNECGRFVELRALEKGNRIRSYGVCAPLQRLLREWTGDVEAAGFLFPSRDHPAAHMSTNTARRIFRA